MLKLAVRKEYDGTASDGDFAQHLKHAQCLFMQYQEADSGGGEQRNVSLSTPDVRANHQIYELCTGTDVDTKAWAFPSARVA